MYNAHSLNADGSLNTINGSLAECLKACQDYTTECWIVRVEDNATILHYPSNVPTIKLEATTVETINAVACVFGLKMVVAGSNAKLYKSGILVAVIDMDSELTDDSIVQTIRTASGK